MVDAPPAGARPALPARHGLGHRRAERPTLLPTGPLLSVLVERQLLLAAKRSWFGFIWPATSPLVMLALYCLVFNRVFTVPIERYPEFLFAGLLPWSFLAQGLTVAIPSLSLEQDLIRRSPFRHELLPLAAVIRMGLYFLLSLAAFLVYLAARGHLFLSTLPWLPLPVAALFLFVISLSLLAALLDVYNRDLRWMLGNLLSVWFFLVPIVYRQEMAPRPLRFLRSVDPMNMIVGQFRDILFWGHLSRPGHLALMLATSSVAFGGALRLFRRCSHELPKDV